MVRKFKVSIEDAPIIEVDTDNPKYKEWRRDFRHRFPEANEDDEVKYVVALLKFEQSKINIEEI
jgi:hypothetical protein